MIIYTHKHGVDCSVYGGRQTAEESARSLMADRIDESWDVLDKIKFEGCETFDDQMTVFHQVEQNVSYGETIEMLEREVQ